MRISDWSSDVCSSDLNTRRCNDIAVVDRPWSSVRNHDASSDHRPAEAGSLLDAVGCRCGCRLHRRDGQPGPHPGPVQGIGRRRRSEEHTSELQSLMRISYAVFCLKKKNKKSYILIYDLIIYQLK